MRRALILALVLAGCATPNAPSVAPTPPTAAMGPFAEAGAAAPLPDDWWRLFDDATLDAHVARALAANRDLRVAAANLAAARANSRLANANRTPDLVLESGASPTTLGVNQPTTTSVPKSSFELGGEVALEVDLFGRLRNQAAAAGADAEAVAAVRDGVRVAVVADTVGAYLDLCSAGVLAGVVRRQIALQSRQVAAVAEQLRAGEVSPLELAQARQLRARLEATLPPIAAEAKRARYLLANLEGLPPAEAVVIDCPRPPAIRAPLPLGDGAALLARRPDLREAERRLAAAAARVKVATAEIYPRVSLGASAGLIAGGVDAFVTPLISWAFVNPARVKARIAFQRANQDAALAQFDALWLRALRETETALADLNAEVARGAALRAAQTDADAAARRAEARVRIGDANPLIALDARRTAFETELLRAQSAQRIARLQVVLFRALGGGWR
ncbi:MAG: hypothetical protein A4S12_08415 [Proteobacteria bacterium SG_bin5]|nr:MAG: hypothetical protein A4S12_08415 [Proteobacteria bacterium SG_bin5]